MKRVVLICLFFVLFGLFVVAQEPDIGDYGDPEDVTGVTDNIPIDPSSGEVDFDNPFNKTKAEMRVEKINKYVGPITKTLFNAELTLSWIFVFSLILWILLIELILMPVSEIFDLNFWLSLLISVIVATISMQSFGDNFVLWMNSIITAWWVGLIVFAASITFGVIYSMVMKTVGEKVEELKEESAKVQTERDRALIHAHAEVSKEELKGR